MRASLVPLVVGFFLVGCTGSDEGAGRQPVLEPTTTVTTEVPVETSPPDTELETTTTTSSTTTSTSATSSTSLPLTIDQPATTSVPADIDETFAEAFAVYEEAWQARQDGARSPADEEVRDRIRQLFERPLLPRLLENLDDQLANDLLNIAVDDRETPRVEFVEGVVSVDDGSLAQFVVCEISTDRVINVVTNEVVYDEVVAITGEVRMAKVSGDWRVTDEVSTRVEFGSACTT